MTTRQVLERALELSAKHLERVGDRRVGSLAENAALLEALGGPMPDVGEDPLRVVEQLAEQADPGLVATPGPRYFGFVIGGVLPAALGADWLASAWDQNAFSYVLSPAASVVEEVSRRWLVDVLGLGEEWSMGLVTGGTMANFTCIAAGRHAALRRAGWDVEENGLYGAPELNVVTNEESHVTVFASLQMLGLGRARVTRVEADDQGRMKPDALRAALEKIKGPLLVCAQAGNVNTGAFDPIDEIAPIVHEHDGWLHVDGAFGAWAAASPSHRPLTNGFHLADSVSVDAHKWLNVPYDCGIAFTKDPASHRAAMTLEAPYYVPSPAEARSNHYFVPEASRRGRGFAVYAALRSLGKQGLAELVDRCCSHARRMAERLRPHMDVRILNDVVLNQVLVRIAHSDERTAEVIRRVQEDGTCWLGGTTWKGMHVMRISVSNWSTTESDIDRSADAILKLI